MKTIWKYNVRPPQSFDEQFPEYTALERQLLWNRGLHTADAIERFLHPDYHETLHDPWLFSQMEPAIDRIQRALENDEQIVVYGDYDADGVCGSAILIEALRYCGADPGVYIPDRNNEGHGLSDEGVAYLTDQGADLIVTVDCGITNHEQIAAAAKQGIDTLVLDHHNVPSEPPPAVAVVNPKDPQDTYPFRGLAGTGVAFKVIQALFEARGMDEAERERREKWLLDRVAIATVADMMPLLDENRTLVRYGLVVLSQTHNPGLQALMDVARLEPTFDTDAMTTNLDTDSIGFRIGPRLNAASRMDHANTAYRLLVTDDIDEAQKLAEELNQHNNDRRAATKRMVNKARQQINEDDAVVILSDEEWSIGLAGLVAGRIVNDVWRPVIIIDRRPDISFGSARSVPGFHLLELLRQCADCFEDFGGHAKAAGFTIRTDRIDDLRTCAQSHAAEMLNEVDIRPRIVVEGELRPEDITFDTIERLHRFEPCGQENPTPLFLLRDWTVTDLRTVGSNGGHLKMWITKEMDDGNIKGVDAIAFGQGDNNDIYVGAQIDIVGELQSNEWNGTTRVQLCVKDIALSGEAVIEEVGTDLINMHPVV